MNSETRSPFYNFSFPHRLITSRKLKFVKKVFRNLRDQIPIQLFTCWRDHKRKPVRCLCNNRKSIVESLKIVLSDVNDSDVSLHTFIFNKNHDHTTGSQIIKNVHDIRVSLFENILITKRLHVFSLDLVRKNKQRGVE